MNHYKTTVMIKNEAWLDQIEKMLNELDLEFDVATNNQFDSKSDHILVDHEVVSPRDFRRPHQSNEVTVLLEEENFREARAWMDAGATSIFIFPKEVDRLQQRLSELKNQFENRRELMRGTEGGNEIWSFYSAKGGSGKSTLATIVSQSLAIHNEKKVLLIDMNSQFGGLESMFGLEGGRNYQQLEVVLDELTPDHIMNVSYPTKSGVHVLLGPADPVRAAELLDNLLPKTIQVAKSYFDYVILDLPSGFSEVSYVGLSEATKVFYVLSPESPAIRAFKQSKPIFESFALKSGKNFHVILNRDSSKNELQAKDVEKIIEEPIYTKISSHFSGIQPYINMGEPYFTKKKGRAANKVSREVSHFVLSVTKEE
ncbi:AAA family ATPase [Aquisalibacillus elongatus]|uniref:Pilus assembly protein CpaE n=1 Tax=Aquisalibacillus elongatus TaxID=485577 RepID=A0A3N5BRD7_9BACI|nr:AAA family ATPase [Aquisalibacillus elongatus]RPF50072.1 pilus assembly protein CpaE [Aquisalibacillus elongatus]